MRLKNKPQYQPSPLTPTPLMTLQQLPQCPQTTTTKLTNFKTSIPIKQYSNQFFRQTHSRHKGISIGEFSQNSQQKRFNTLMKKQMMSKYTMRHGRKQAEKKCKEGRASMITIKGYSKKDKKRSVTEMEPSSTYQHFHHPTENTEPESTITELEQELIVSESFVSNLLSPPSCCLLKQQEQGMEGGKQKTEPSWKEQVGKISQSRGLQLFSKLYIKDKSMMVQRSKDSHRKFKKTISIGRELGRSGQNSFETKKIIPIEKSKKKELISRGLEHKKIVRTPMKTIDNHYTTSTDLAHRNKQEALDQLNEPFEIKGWDTTL